VQIFLREQQFKAFHDVFVDIGHIML